MRIGIDARMYRAATAGIGRYSRNLITNLLETDRDDEFVLFMTDEDYREFKSKGQSSNAQVRITNIPHYSLAEQTKLAKIIEREKCDLVHFLNFNHPVRFKGKFVVMIHDLTLFHFPEAAKKTNPIKRWAYEKIMRHAIVASAKIIVPSEFTKMDVLKFQKIDPQKIAVIYEAADDRKFKAMGAKVEKKRPIILYVGQYREHKNIKRLLEAYKILKREVPCQLVLVGNVPEEYQKMIDNDANLGDTKMPGFVNDDKLAAHYLAADVFVFPSLYEGFGLPGLEAMAAGLPVACSDKSSLPEIYGDAALYFDPLNPHDIADKMRMLLKDKNLRQKFAEKGKLQVKKYSWQKTAQETLKIYKELLEV